jgi:hypothetical protein
MRLCFFSIIRIWMSLPPPFAQVLNGAEALTGWIVAAIDMSLTLVGHTFCPLLGLLLARYVKDDVLLCNIQACSFLCMRASCT